MKNPNYRIAWLNESGEYVQKDYRSFKAAQAQLLRWTNGLSLISGDKLTLTIEVL